MPLERNQELDAARGIAALSVAIGHCVTHLAGVPSHSVTVWGLSQLTGWQAALRVGSSLFNADAAVVLFFVLSGHVLSRSLEHRHEYGGYFVRRAFRLFPVGIVAAIPFAIAMHADLPAALGTAFLVDHSLNGVIWSLQVELVGSAMVFVLVLLESRQTAVLSGLALFAAALAWNEWLLLFLPAFALGYLVTCFWRRAAASRGMLVAGIIVLLFADLTSADAAAVRVVQMGAAYVVVACLNAQRYLKLEMLVPQFLGAVSYPFYLLHPFFMMILSGSPAGDGWPLVGSIALLAIESIACVLGVSWVVHVGVEKPFIRLGNRIIARSRSWWLALRSAERSRALHRQ